MTGIDSVRESAKYKPLKLELQILVEPRDNAQHTKPSKLYWQANKYILDIPEKLI